MMNKLVADHFLLVPDKGAAATGVVESIADDSGRDEKLIVDLVVRAREGDRESFARLYEIYGKMVHGVLLARVPHAEVDDLVQEVFLTAFRRLSTLRDERTFGGWLAVIARNRAHDFHRRARRTEELTEAHAAHDARSADAHEALRLLQMLPEAYRETLVMRLVEGMSGAEIAARTNLTPASVRVNLHRGMRRLREIMDARKEAK